MITIHATKKLHAKLPLDDNGRLKTAQPSPHLYLVPVANNPLSGWHANLITLQRRNCVLLVHDATRFPLFMKGLVKADFARFDWLFADSLMNTLLELDANQQQLDTAAGLLAPCRFDTDCNRSVQGTMNQMKGDLEYSIWSNNTNLDDVSAYGAGAWLADRPCTIKGQRDCIWPDRAMLQLLSKENPKPTAPGSSTNVVNIDDHRR
jgi:hypothetical protein